MKKRTKRKIEEPVVTAVTFDKNQVKMTILDVPDRPGVAGKIFGALAKENINIDMIIQSAARGRKNDISFTISYNDLKKAVEVLEEVSKELNAGGVVYEDNMAKVSIIGVGMKSHPGVAAKMFETLGKENINIEMISTSEIKVSCIIKKEHLELAVRSLHEAFNLSKKVRI
ncbi:MAG: ACT domain-containing protein [Endomicrobia bacterium]|nr:ACT domain-containing protein [Endomicrobiia bacterium]MCX7941005.1 ACT domain-containing protein [Endomicrobiia bacterium]MDW8055422.1 ACT domain-containing protein [Elusimicrobiota bacterium]